MADDDFTIPTRDALVRRYERDYKLVRPSAKTGEKTQVNVDAKVAVDVFGVPVLARARRLARLTLLEDMADDQLEDEAVRLGLAARLPATGATGFVVVTTSATGAAIIAGDELYLDGTNLRFKFTESGTYTTGAEPPIIGISTGLDTNLPPGTVLKISNPRAGMGTTAVVVEQEPGVGLQGGHAVESRPELIERIKDARANPPASGNDAEIQKAVRETPDVAVQAPFTWPCFGGPGTTGVGFTVRPSSPGASRIPNAVQMSRVYQRLRSKFPKDFTEAMVTIDYENVALSLKVSWSALSAGWADTAPWPLFADAWVIDASTTPSATAFSISGGATVPSVGTTIAFFDSARRVFVRKRFLTVTASGGGVYLVTCDPTNNASELSYVPVAGERMCPWSDSLQALVAPTVAQFDLLGPGEQFPTPFFDPGLRQRRSPPSPDRWPSSLSVRALIPLYDLTVVSDVTPLDPALPLTPTIGTPGDTASLLRLNKLYGYP